MYFQFPFRSLFLFFVTKNHLWPEPQLASIKSPPIRKKTPWYLHCCDNENGFVYFLDDDDGDDEEEDDEEDDEDEDEEDDDEASLFDEDGEEHEEPAGAGGGAGGAAGVDPFDAAAAVTGGGGHWHHIGADNLEDDIDFIMSDFTEAGGVRTTVQVRALSSIV